MSRHGYTDDSYNPDWDYIRASGATWSAINGKRGQAFLREMITALDAMPVKELHAEVLARDGCMCAMGAVANARGLDVTDLDPEDPSGVADALNIADAMSRAIAYENDEGGPLKESPGHRWRRMRQWAADRINDEAQV